MQGKMLKEDHREIGWNGLEYVKDRMEIESYGGIRGLLLFSITENRLNPFKFKLFSINMKCIKY